MGQFFLIWQNWHILEDNDPNINIDEAKTFFEMISSEYSSVPNILYEICNEPNGDTDWNDVYGYSEQIIKIIRNNNPDSIILVGTPDYDRIPSLPQTLTRDYGIIAHLIRNIAYRVLR